jgi:hypothetical protein
VRKLGGGADEVGHRPKERSLPSGRHGYFANAACQFVTTMNGDGAFNPPSRAG